MSRGDAQGRLPEQALLDILGLAVRARAVIMGTDAVRGGIRKDEVRFVLLAGDASPTQQRKLIPLLEARGIPYRVLLTRERIGAAAGKGPVSAVGIKNQSFAVRAAELSDAFTSPQEQV
ncbi:MAG: L7Ae/L30e/S12e/Gadd45 family ribosomal protein [Gemmatimonadota bacterium]|nr:L7Ae/L30e/S12e/Gadd45 family ribosomal protein [Gemmatimonadota bacterium]